MTMIVSSVAGAFPFALDNSARAKPLVPDILGSLIVGTRCVGALFSNADPDDSIRHHATAFFVCGGLILVPSRANTEAGPMCFPEIVGFLIFFTGESSRDFPIPFVFSFFAADTSCSITSTSTSDK